VVPFALSKSSQSTPVAALPQATPPPSGDTAVPALNVQSTPGQSRLPGHGRDPFAQQGGTTGSSLAPTGTTSSTGTSGLAGGTTGATTAGTTAAGPTSSAAPISIQPNTPLPSIVTNHKPKPAPTGLSATQAYDVALTITNASGGLNTVDPLSRLSVVPSEQQPLLVELGVLKGGSRVLFLVRPGTAVAGPGLCTPGPIDCEILSLRQDQTERVGVQSAGDQVTAALFAITGITAVKYPSAAAATKARRSESAAGRALLDRSSAVALSLFRYDASVGTVLDLRTLTVGES
jgi:hypothetical protein